MKSLGGGYYGMYTSDTDGNGTVNASDRSSVWNNRNLSTQVPASTNSPMTLKENENE